MSFLQNLIDPLNRYRHQPGEPRLNVRMDLTNRCNLLCKMCHYPNTVHHPKFDMEPDLVRKIVEQVFPYTERATLACQYEAFMSRHIEEILQIVANGPCDSIGVVTNGTLLTERRARLLLETQVFVSMAISIDGGTRETYERIRVNGNWDKLVANLERLHALKQEYNSVRPVLQFNTVLMKSTALELPKLVELAIRVGVARIEAIRYLEVNPSLGEGIPDWEAVIPALVEAKNMAHAHGIDLLLPIEDPRLVTQTDTVQEVTCNTAEIGKYSEYCEAPWQAVQIYPNGDIHPCGYYGEPFGNIREQNFEEIWNSPRYLELRRSLVRMRLHSKCQACNPHGYDNMERKRRINVAV